MKLIEKHKRKPIYSDFKDQIGAETDVSLPGFGERAGFAKFRAKTHAYLRAHQDHIALHKSRMNKTRTMTGLIELERMPVESGVGAREDVDRAKSESHGLGLLV